MKFDTEKHSDIGHLVTCPSPLRHTEHDPET